MKPTNVACQKNADALSAQENSSSRVEQNAACVQRDQGLILVIGILLLDQLVDILTSLSLRSLLLLGALGLLLRDSLLLVVVASLVSSGLALATLLGLAALGLGGLALLWCTLVRPRYFDTSK